MKDLTIPLPDFLEEQIAEVEVTINGKKRKFNFRVESFPWDSSAAETDDQAEQIKAKIEVLKSNLDKYDEKWELIQIFTPREDAKHIQVLFRQKK